MLAGRMHIGFVELDSGVGGIPFFTIWNPPGTGRAVLLRAIIASINTATPGRYLIGTTQTERPGGVIIDAGVLWGNLRPDVRGTPPLVIRFETPGGLPGGPTIIYCFGTFITQDSPVSLSQFPSLFALNPGTGIVIAVDAPNLRLGITLVARTLSAALPPLA